MRNYDIEVEIDIEDILADVGCDLPVPACPVYRGVIGVTVSGSDTPAVLWPNDKVQPAEYREAEADLFPCELAWQVWAAYSTQVGLLIWQIVTIFCGRLRAFAGSPSRTPKVRPWNRTTSPQTKTITTISENSVN